MKNKIIYNFIFFSLAVFSFSACEEDLEIWDSSTLDYSGTFFWELYSEDMSTKYESYDHDNQILIYNTSDNVANNVWLEDTGFVFPLKSKFYLDGTAESFKSTSDSFDALPNNYVTVEDPDEALPATKPTGLNEEVTVDASYIRNTILEGKILKNAGTTVSGNPVDSLYVKIKLYSGTVTYESYLLAEELWEDPEVEQFEWKFKSAVYDNTLDETYIISGHRKTGFAEDDH
ncbi:MAG: lipid-binding protein [Flavobacteriaceae bacterium]